MDVAERIDPVRGWLATVSTLLVVLVGGSLVAPRLVYDGFIWAYFWGPVVADANAAACAVKTATGVSFLGSDAACASATGIVAYPGYTVVSEVGYAITLLIALIGVIFLLRRLDIGQTRTFFFALIPYIFLGGALRVVEDANNALATTGDAVLAYPTNTLIISPVIYFTMFAITLAALLLSVWLERTGTSDTFAKPLAAIGTALLASSIAYLLGLAFTTDAVGFYPQVAGIVLVLASLLSIGVWVLIERGWPALNQGTRWMGFVVLWAHTLDGVANVIGIDFGAELGLPYGDLVPKHPANRALISVGEQFPTALQHAIGTAWPFLVVKILAAIFVLYIFDETVVDDSPRYSILLLVAIVAVGLGPGTRDMLRATFGI